MVHWPTSSMFLFQILRPCLNLSEQAIKDKSLKFDLNRDTSKNPIALKYEKVPYLSTLKKN